MQLTYLGDLAYPACIDWSIALADRNSVPSVIRHQVSSPTCENSNVEAPPPDAKRDQADGTDEHIS